MRRPVCPRHSKVRGRQWGKTPEGEAGLENADHLGLIGLGKDLGFFPKDM